jgi:AcrR family transcriptional regulator
MKSIQPKVQSLPAKDRILLAAHDLFYQEGIRATGVDRVIAESSVTKVTFYRHFPSKNALILEFLQHRHQLWISWFQDALQRHGGNAKAIAPALAEWFRSDGFRGCAFINSVSELAGAMPEVIEIARQHKQEMAAIIASLLPPSRQRLHIAQAIALAVDGAIIRAQFDETPDDALLGMERILKSLLIKKSPQTPRQY